MLPGATGSGVSVLVTERSALPAPTVVVAVPDSLPVFGSVVVDDAVAVFDSTVPGTVAGSTATMSVNTALPAGNDAIEQEIVPPAPIMGVVHDQPPGDASDTKVVPAGKISDRLTPAALLGPALDAVMV